MDEEEELGDAENGEEEQEEDKLIEISEETANILRDWLASKLRLLTQHDSRYAKIYSSLASPLFKNDIWSKNSASSSLANYKVGDQNIEQGDFRALSIRHYRDGQRRIMKEALAELNDIIAQAEDESSNEDS